MPERKLPGKSIVPQPEIVGREAELAHLNSLLEDTIAGRGRIAFIGGDPGIGKTRLATEVASVAAQRRIRTAWGHCLEGDGAPPYWPWVQVLRALAASDQHRENQNHPPPRGSLEELLAVPHGSRPSTERLEPTRFALFESMLGAIDEGCAVEPLLVVLDDVHWADDASIRFLEFLAPEVAARKLMLLCTYRPSDVAAAHPLSRALGSLQRPGISESFQLAGLGDIQLVELVSKLTELTIPGSLMRAIGERAEGNPLFAGEIVRLLLQDGALVEGTHERDKDWVVRIPPGISEVIRSRIRATSKECHSALEIASAFGRHFDAVEVSKHLAGTGPAPTKLTALLNVLDEAVRLQLVEAGQVAGEYRFTHPMIRDVVYAGLPTGTRAQLHARIAESWMPARGERLSLDRAMSLANHLVLAQPVGDRASLIQYSLEAGEQALAALASTEAARVAVRALNAVRPHATALEVAELSLLAGRSHAQAMRGEEALEYLERACELATEAGSTGTAIAAAATRLGLFSTTLPRWQKLIERGLELAPPDSADQCLLLIRQAWVAGAAGVDFPGARSSVAAAIAIARKLGDRALNSEALAASSAIALWTGDWTTLLKESEKLLADSSGRQMPASASGPAHFNAALACLELGRPSQAMPHIEAATREARSIGNRLDLLGALELSLSLSAFRGDWEGARRLHAEAEKLDSNGPQHLVIRAFVEIQTGAFAEGRRFQERALASAGPSQEVMFPIILEVPYLAAMTGDERGVDEAASVARSILAVRSEEALVARMAQSCLAMISIAQQDTDEARTLYRLLSARHASLATGMISADRILGGLARILGDRSGAARHYQDAMEWASRAGYEPELAWARFDYATMLIGSAGGIDRPVILKLLGDAGEAAEKLGMTPLASRIEAARESLARRRGGRPDYPKGLTGREVEVLRLIAAGQSNRQISEALVISEFTVARHVSNVLAKVGAANRSELVVFAMRNGLAG